MRRKRCHLIGMIKSNDFQCILSLTYSIFNFSFNDYNELIWEIEASEVIRLDRTYRLIPFARLNCLLLVRYVCISYCIDLLRMKFSLGEVESVLKSTTYCLMSNEYFFFISSSIIGGFQQGLTVKDMMEHDCTGNTHIKRVDAKNICCSLNLNQCVTSRENICTNSMALVPKDKDDRSCVEFQLIQFNTTVTKSSANHLSVRQ